MVTRTHTTGRIRNPFEITVRHSTHSNARMRAPPHTHEGERGAWCVHSPLGCATHAKMFGKLLPLLLAIKSPFLAIFVVCVCVSAINKLPSCDPLQFDSHNSTAATPPCAFATHSQGHSQVQQIVSPLFVPPPIFRLVYRATRERNVLHIKFIATQLSQARCVETPQMQAH